MVPSQVTTYTWPSPPDGPTAWTNEVIAAPLVHSSLPVAASSAYRMAGFESCARRAALIWASPPRYSPLDSAKATPFTIVAGTGEIMSRETHDGCRAGVPFSSTTLYATMAPLVTGPFVEGTLVSGSTCPPPPPHPPPLP